MPDFTLIDLTSQHAQVAQYTRGKSREYILSWLRQFGEVQQIWSPYDSDLYGFRSLTGVTTGFRLTPDGQIIVLGDHTTITHP